MSTPLLSVCLITYNHEKFIRQAIEGVLMQQVDFDWELIIADDFSTDGTRAILLEYKQKYPQFIKLILQEKNVGPAQNWFDLITAPQSKYIAYFEGDDYWSDSLKLQKQVDFLEKNADYVLCFHQIEILNLDNELVADFLTKVPENYETLETLAKLGNYIHSPSVVYRNCISEFPPEFHQCPIGDYFLYIMLATHGKLKYMEDKMAVYRYGVGMYSGKSLLNLAKSNVKLFACLLSYLKDDVIKKIIFNRYLEASAVLDSSIANQYKNHFISDHTFFRALKLIKQPSVLMQKITKKIFKIR